MAENKRSFLLYTDLIHTVSKLADDQAGILFKHILKYVNDENPETDNILIQIAFEPIKQQLKRDLKKYEGIVKHRKLAGMASAEKRKQKQQVSTSVNKCQQDSTNATDNDNVNDNVNDNDSVSDNDIDNKKKYNKIPPSLIDIKDRMIERGITSFNAENFFAFYESKGWKVGNSKMKNWDAALTTWNGRDSGTATKAPTYAPKFKNYDEMCQAALTNSDIWKQMVALKLPDMPKTVWAHPNDIARHGLEKYKV